MKSDERERWYRCPHCGGKIQKLTEDSVMMDVPLYCKHCHMESRPMIYGGREYGDDEPFPLFESR
jgi:uncharacterized protein with PIN domain